jgi:hypothetical protein
MFDTWELMTSSLTDLSQDTHEIFDLGTIRRKGSVDEHIQQKGVVSLLLEESGFRVALTSQTQLITPTITSATAPRVDELCTRTRPAGAILHRAL